MTILESEVTALLKTIKYPGFSRDIVSFGLVKETSLRLGVAHITLEIATKEPSVAETLRRDIESRVGSLKGIRKVELTIHVQAPPTPAEQTARPAKIDGVRHIVAIASGKGGVGKSTVTTNVACAAAQIFAEQGLVEAVGIMDCDIYGPSIPLMLGIGTEPEIENNQFIPPENFGVECMSMGYFAGPNAPIVWRGPRIHQTITQFIRNVSWGNKEIIFVDLPPGTGDAHLSLCQTVALDGVVIVTTPQAAAVNVALRGAMMFPELNVPFIGVVENMSYMEDSTTGKKLYPFGQGGGAHTAANLDCDFLGQVPLDSDLRAGGDHGIPIVISAPESMAAFAFRSVAAQIIQQLYEFPALKATSATSS